MSTRSSRGTLRFALLLSALGSLIAGSLASAAPPNPAIGSANVDGNAAEWSAADHFSNMLRAGGNGGQTAVESTLSLRYSCAQKVMYAYVAASPGVTIRSNEPGESFIKLGVAKQVDGNSGDDGVAPDFAWVGLAGATASGWEASFPLLPGSYTLNVHTQVNDGGSQTSAVPNRSIPLVVSCDYVPEELPLQVTKTAHTGFDRTYDWTVDKQVTPATQTTSNDQASVTYTVAVTKSPPVDSQFAVTGTITVANPNGSPISGVTITDQIQNGPTCAVTGGTNVTVPANASVVVDYTCALAAKADGLNEAAATWSGGVSAGSAPFAFGAPTTVTHDTVTVTDVFNGGVPVLLSSANGILASTTFTYSASLVVPASGCVTYPNLVTIASPQELVKQDGAQAEVCRAQQPPPVVTPPTVIGVEATPATLAILKRGPQQARAGATITFTITVRNTSANPAHDVRVADILPAGFALAARPKGATLVKGRLVWSVGTLAPGQATTLRVKLAVLRTTAGLRCNRAEGSSSNAPTVSARACTRVLRVAGVVRVPIVTG